MTTYAVGFIKLINSTLVSNNVLLLYCFFVF